MKWLEIFKIYCLKKLKEEKASFLFSMISILVVVSISIIIPIVNLEIENNREKNIKKINGGDLAININSNISVEFEKEIKRLEKEEIKVEKRKLLNCYYLKNSNNILGAMVIGDYNLNEDEIILQSALAKTLNLNVGDYIEINTNGNGIFKYKIKQIEFLPSGVDRDAELLGYGKVNNSKNLEGVIGRELIHMKGMEGEELKRRLKKVDENQNYISLNDKRKEIKDEMLIQKTSLGILSTVGYIFSILTIITTTLMIILKRKKEIAILKLLSIDTRGIKKAMGLEMGVYIGIPVILSFLTSFLGARLILNNAGIYEKLSRESIILIIKGLIFNGLLFFIILNVTLFIISNIKPIAVLREDSESLNKGKKKIFIRALIITIGTLILYSIYTKSVEVLGSSLIILILTLIFLLLIWSGIKILAMKKYKNPIIMYSIIGIKNRFFSFVLVLLSLTLTLWFILIGFSLENTIKDSLANSFKEILPYDYYIESKDNEGLERVIENNKNIEGFIKTFDIDGQVTNEKFNSFYRNIVISEVNKESYGVKYKIIMGENLFEGEEGILISDKMRENNSLDIGDILEIQTNKGNLKAKIKGVYESGGINTLNIIKEKVEMGEKIGYFIKSEDESFINELKDSYVINTSVLGERLASNISGFIKVFRMLSLICLLGTILFNVNMIYINSISEEKNEEILMAIGHGRSFIIKAQILRLIIIGGIASILSVGTFYISINLFIKMMVNRRGSLSKEEILINIIIGIIILLISFSISLKKILNKRELNLLREIN